MDLRDDQTTRSVAEALVSEIARHEYAYGLDDEVAGARRTRV
jgi:hypothetical protein